MLLFLCYPGCSTCKKARSWLDEHKIAYRERDIKEENPTEEELSAWIARSGLDSRRFFNTSGMKYRELALKEKLPAMNETERALLLASDGMLVKRPLVIGGDFVLCGFREDAWERQLIHKEGME